MKKIKIAILGASGYTGVELIRILLNHENAEIKALIANSNASQKIQDLYQHLNSFNLPILQKVEEVDFKEIDLVFGCLPHGFSQEIIKKLSENYSHLKFIDLSADFRLKNGQDYEKWYNHEHIALNLQEKAVYGLSEINRDKIKKANLVACPGCYPTSILLPLIPLLENNLIKIENIISDSKSGVSGAGRAIKQQNLFCEINNSFKAYGIGNHRHTSEIEQELSNFAKNTVEIDFTPHLIPINRGIISTIYADLQDGITIEDVKNCLKTKYEDEYFVDIEENVAISDVASTNFCKISVNQARTKNKVILVSAIDNLCKGASGQAVQNMNIMFDFDERTGLNFLPIFP